MVVDINGDSLTDFAISDTANRVYVVYGATGSPGNLTLAASSVDGSSLRGFAITINDIDGTAATSTQYGTRHRLAPIGDFNGDGLSDFIVGNSFGDNYAVTDAGKILCDLRSHLGCVLLTERHGSERWLPHPWRVRR